MPDPHEMNPDRRVLQESQITGALGVFLLSFAGIVVLAVWFTPTFIGKLTDLVAGGIIGLIGAGMVYRSRKRVS